MRLSWRVCLLASILMLAGCHHQPPVPVVATPTPASTIALEAAKREFAAGDYASASVDLQRFLQLVPADGDGIDYALFQLGIIYSLPATGRQDWPRATGYFNRLATEFPQSSLKPAAQLIVSTREQSVQLSADVARLTDETSQLRADSSQQSSQIAKLRGDAEQQSDQIAKLKTGVDERSQEIEKRDLIIRQLNVQIDQLRTQLERLIRVDSDRRPRP